MSSRTPHLPKFRKTQDDRGFVSWECNFCGWKNRQPQYPKSHNCASWRGRRATRSGGSRFEQRVEQRVESDRLAEERRSVHEEEGVSVVSDRVSDHRSVEEDTLESDNREVPSPYN